MNTISLGISQNVQCPQDIIEEVAKTPGWHRVYTWYEGTQGLSETAAEWLRSNLLQPLYMKNPRINIGLYSLKGWDFFRTVSQMPQSTPLGKTIEAIDAITLRCFYAADFFRYCARIKEGSVVEMIVRQLAEKAWLHKLSSAFKPKGISVGSLFDKQPCCLTPLYAMDIQHAYAPLQYLEGYYLIHSAVREALDLGEKQISVSFILPNDESKYYADYPEVIPAWLKAEFGDAIQDVSIQIDFKSFLYGKTLTDRPYIQRDRKLQRISPETLPGYFSYLSQKPTYYPRDYYHNLNGYTINET